jgi:hypothetical protein
MTKSKTTTMTPSMIQVEVDMTGSLRLRDQVEI